jgi:hypothetical protein
MGKGQRKSAFAGEVTRTARLNDKADNSINTVELSASEFLDDAARHIVAQHHAELPRLNTLTTLITPRAAPALREALARAARARGAQTLMLPRVTTLREWASEIDVGATKVTPDAERVLDVFSILKKQRWFSASETLALSHELVRLADELTDQLVTLPRSIDEHVRALARAYGIAKQNVHFSFEAQLTYDVWRTLAEATAQSMDAATRYGLQLAKLADEPRGTLYVIGLADYSRRELAFFSSYAKDATVTQFASMPANDKTVWQREKSLPICNAMPRAMWKTKPMRRWQPSKPGSLKANGTLPLSHLIASPHADCARLLSAIKS